MNRSETNPTEAPVERPSDAQLRSAADRVRRLSAGIDTPDDGAADLSTFSEEALRRSFRIVQLGVEFWMNLLRLDPARSLASSDESHVGYGTTVSDPGWLFGRTLGSMIRAWGDIKNAQRGLLWFDSSPLLGPKMGKPVELESLEPVVRLLNESAIDMIEETLEAQWAGDWKDDGTSRELLILGVQSGALEREQRNPQGTSEALLHARQDTVLAFCIEGPPTANAGGDVSDLDSTQSDSASSGKQAQIRRAVVVENRTATTSLDQRATDLIQRAQGGQDTFWDPLYSFLRRGDVVAISLAGDIETTPIGPCGTNWQLGRPFALAIVTSPTNWNETGWWGRVGCALLLDGPPWEPESENRQSPGNESSVSPDRERLRTAFRFPVAAPEDMEKLDALAVSFGLADSEDGKRRTTESLGLERIRLYRKWLRRKDEETSPDGAERRLDEALIEAIPAGFPGPWRRVKNHDLRATLAEFLEPHAATVGYFEHQVLAEREGEERAGDPWLAWYTANLNIERFALTSDNLRLGVIFNNPIRANGRPSAQRVAPDPVPGTASSDKQGPGVESLTDAQNKERKRERDRIAVANAHRLSFDHFKRGMTAGAIERPVADRDRGNQRESGRTMTPEQERATAFMPAIRLNPNFTRKELKESGFLLPESSTGILWSKACREDEDRSPPWHLTENILEWFEQSPVEGRKGGEITVAAFPEAEQVDLYRATDARHFSLRGLTAQQGRVAVDPAGTRVRDVLLISSSEHSDRLLVILTDDSVASVDVGAIVWMLIAYGEELERDHLLDQNAHRNHRQRDTRTADEDDSESSEAAESLSRDSWEILSSVKVSPDSN